MKAIASFVGEEEESPVFETVGCEVLGKGGEAVIRFTHVAGFHAKEDAQVAAESHHARPTASFLGSMKTLNFSELDDAPGGERNLIGIPNHKAHPVLKDEVPLAFAGMGDLNFDEHRVGERPGFAWFGF